MERSILKSLAKHRVFPPITARGQHFMEDNIPVKLKAFLAGGMPPTAKQEMQNRKILEELHQQKKLLLKQGQAPAPNAPTASTVPTPTATVNLGESHILSVNQRTALQHAHAHSVGYFITQDSSFGNLILPVLPRFENK